MPGTRTVFIEDNVRCKACNHHHDFRGYSVMEPGCTFVCEHNGCQNKLKIAKVRKGLMVLTVEQ